MKYDCKRVNFNVKIEKKIFNRCFSFLLKILVPSSEKGAKIVVSRLVRGNYFGEISLLKLDDGHNRFAILFADFFLYIFFENYDIISTVFIGKKF